MSDKLSVPELFVGKRPLYAYEKFGLNALLSRGQVYVLARGLLISKAVLIAHRLCTRYKNVAIATEETYIEQLPFSSNKSGESSELQNTQATRSVPVYKARLIYQREGTAPAVK